MLIWKNKESFPPVTDLNVNYKKSIFYREKVKVKTWVEKYSRLRSVYKYEIFQNE